DLYPEETGKRLFPLIAIGATAGAASGAWMAKRLVGSFGTYGLLLIAAAVLSLSLFAMRQADSLGAEGKGSREGRLHDAHDAPLRDAAGGLSLVFRHKYLIATAVL